MEYLCLVYVDERELAAWPAGRHDASVAEHLALGEALAQSGRLIAAGALAPSANAVTVRRREGRSSVGGGPFAQTKEQLGAYFLIEARDLNDAIRVASRIPAARHGAIEVRPVRTRQTSQPS